MSLKSINPSNNKVIFEVNELSPKQINKKIDDSYATFLSWRDTDISGRSKYIKLVASKLRQNKDKYAEIITSEVGKTLEASLAEIEKCAGCLEYYAINAKNFLKPKSVSTDASKSYIRFDPIGIVLAVMPWNFPFWQVIRFAAPAIMAGNVGILKHASNVQMSAQALEDLFSIKGYSNKLFQNLAISSSLVESVIRNPKVMAVTLTGSEYAGSQVAKTAGEEIKKTVLELGGSDPFIVLKDADISEAVNSAISGRMQNNAGQSCIAAKRFIVDRSIKSKFVNDLKSKLSQLVVGDPMIPGTNMGPLANEQMVLDIEKQVNKSLKMGAKLVLGGKRLKNAGCFYAPTILTNVTKGMPVYDEEVFGPVLPIIDFKDVNEAVSIANDCIYGLGSTIFTKNIKLAEEIAIKIESGNVFINNQVKSDSRLPFGGVKKSGYGRELSDYGIKEFVNIKTVYIK